MTLRAVNGLRARLLMCLLVGGALSGCATFHSDLNWQRMGARPDEPKIGTDETGKPVKTDDKACGEYPAYSRYSQGLMEAYHSRATLNRVWIYAAGQMLRHPLLGFGLGREIPAGVLLRGYQSGELVVEGARLGYAHNTFLDVGLQMGLVGLLLLVWLLGAMLVALWRAWRAAPAGYPRAVTAGVLAVALAFPVRAMTNNYFVDDPVILFWFLTALAIAAVPGPESLVPGRECAAPGSDSGLRTRDAGLG